jgi:two-component system chemotaxis sensor kinase CheA
VSPETARSDTDDLLGPLLATFAVEAAEHLQAMNRHLLCLERGEGDALLGAELFREAHSMKGAARAVDLLEVEGLAHELEDTFAGLRNDPGRPGQAVLDRAYQTLDAIAALVEAATAAVPAHPPTGPHPTGPHPTGSHPAGSHPAGTDPAGADPAGTDPAGADPAGADPAGADPAGADEPAQAVTSGGREVGLPRPPGETVRVATAKLDALMAEVGELLVTRIGVEQRLADAHALDALLADWQLAWSRPRYRGLAAASAATGGAAALDESRARLGAARTSLGELRRGLEADVRRMAQVSADLQDDVRRTRMVPAATVFEVFPRMVRDLARASGKEVTLRAEGGTTEVDRSVLDQVKDPLTHLLRNCVDHGIEPPQARAGAGKPRHGTICLSARQRNDMLVVEVADDGAGIDPARVRAAAAREGLLAAEAAEDLTDRETIGLIFQSGLSTSPVVTDLSGRGVGLDVVRDAVERLHGSVDVHSTTGRGTTFVLSLPLSVSTVHCLLLQAGGQTFAVPATLVQRVARVAADTVERAAGRDVVRVGDRPVALARLADVLGVETSDDGADPGATRPVAVLGVQGAHVALLVERLAGTHELVVKSLPPPLARVRHVAGAAVLGSGEVAMVLNAADLVASVERGEPHRPATPAAPVGGPATILVAEDSITTRTLEKNVLEAAGYRVAVAADGLAAWTLLRSSDCDLVVADIEMPRMDGFELTARIRADPRLADLPVVLVTSRDSREDHERGAQVGADAYIVKGGFDQNRLIDTIRRLT